MRSSAETRYCSQRVNRNKGTRLPKRAAVIPTAASGICFSKWLLAATGGTLVLPACRAFIDTIFATVFRAFFLAAFIADVFGRRFGSATGHEGETDGG